MSLAAAWRSWVSTNPAWARGAAIGSDLVALPKSSGSQCDPFRRATETIPALSFRRQSLEVEQDHLRFTRVEFLPSCSVRS